MTNGKPQREQPWSVRGVSHEARSAAGIAAKQADETLGAWLDRTIRDAAAEQLKGSSKQEVGPTVAETMAQAIDEMRRLNQRLDQQDEKLAVALVERQNAGLFGMVRRFTGGKPTGGK